MFVAIPTANDTDAPDPSRARSEKGQKNEQGESPIATPRSRDSEQTPTTAPSPQSTIAGQTFSWARGVILGKTYATGSALITSYQKIYGTGKLLGENSAGG